jgi:outer membrane protein assembly factor BamB
MQRFHPALAALLVFFWGPVLDSSAQSPGQLNDGFEVAAGDWPWWRGPQRNGTAHPGQDPPLEFSENQNVVWKAKVPGRGYGSPTVFGEQVFLATADEASGAQGVLCVERMSGKHLWHTTVHAQGGMRKNNKSTAASSTPACDGQRIFINFPNSDALVTTALDLSGNILWQTPISAYVVHQGYGASPALYQSLVIVSADNKGGGAVAGLRRDTGEIVWKQARPAVPNYASPTLVHAAGKDQLIMVGCDQIVSYAPLTGEILWQTEGATTECVTSTVTDGRHVYTSGGYPTNHMSALAADGSAKVVWKNNNRLYVPSLVIRDGYLYGVLDAGIAMCWKADTGEEMWRERLRGDFSASPVLVGDRIYATGSSGILVAAPAKTTAFW